MASPQARRALLIVAGNLAVMLALLTVTELVSRLLEQGRADLQHPELRRLPAKSGSELRVFAFGGSTVWGDPVPEVGFVAQMQHWVRRLYPDRDIRIYNFGKQGEPTSYVLHEFTRRLADQPDLIIVITGHNEFMYRGGEVNGQVPRIRQWLLSHFATMRLLEKCVGRFRMLRKGHMMPNQVEPWDRESALFKNRMATFGEEVNLIVARAREKGVALIVGTLPSNLSDWPPVYKRLSGRDQRYSHAVSRIQALLQSGKYGEASDAVTSAFNLYREDAMLYFLRGQIQSAVGAYADARESFVRARDLDPVPLRATSQINSIIRSAASGAPVVTLIDLEKVFEEHSKNGLVGFELIGDNCHSTPLGDSIIAEAIIRTMTEIGLLPPRKAENECCPVDTFFAAVGYLEPKSPLRLHVLLATGIYAMKAPFLNFEASRKYLLEAMKVDEESWKVWANLATLSYFTGDTAAGGRQLRRATELRHAPLDMNDRYAIPYLKEALEYARSPQSAQPPWR